MTFHVPLIFFPLHRIWVREELIRLYPLLSTRLLWRTCSSCAFALYFGAQLPPPQPTKSSSGELSPLRFRAYALSLLYTGWVSWVSPHPHLPNQLLRTDHVLRVYLVSLHWCCTRPYPRQWQERDNLLAGPDAQFQAHCTAGFSWPFLTESLDCAISGH